MVAFKPSAMLTRGPIKSMLARANAADLDTLRGMIEAGKLRPVIDKTYPFADAPAALAHLETKRAKGKIVVEVA